MSASDCKMSITRRGTRPRRSETAAGSCVGALAWSGVGVDLARAGGVTLGRAALRVGRLGADVGLALEALGLRLELLGARAPTARLGPAGAGLDAALAARALALAARRQREQHEQQDHDGDDDDDQSGAHRRVLLSGVVGRVYPPGRRIPHAGRG